jgi:hypothetical protein
MMEVASVIVIPVLILVYGLYVLERILEALGSVARIIWDNLL